MTDRTTDSRRTRSAGRFRISRYEITSSCELRRGSKASWASSSACWTRCSSSSSSSTRARTCTSARRSSSIRCPGGGTPDIARAARPHARTGRRPAALLAAALQPPRRTPDVADLGAGGIVRPRRPRAPRDAARTGRRGRAARVARGLLVASPGPPPAALGDDAARRAGGRALGAGDARRTTASSTASDRSTSGICCSTPPRDAPPPPAQPLPAGDGQDGEHGHGRFWLSPGLVAARRAGRPRRARCTRASRFDRARAAVELVVRDEVIAAPQSSLNGPMSGTRHFATVRLDLADVKAVKYAPRRHRQRRRARALRRRAAAPAARARRCAARGPARAGAGEHPQRRTRSTRSATS